MDSPEARAGIPLGVKSTIVDGHHNGKHWVAHFNCDHRQKHDRRPRLGETVTCRPCTGAYDLTNHEVDRVESRMLRLQQSRGAGGEDGV